LAYHRTGRFFLENVAPRSDINHRHKRLQHLAGRYLLQILEPDFPLHLISISDSNKPFLHDEEFYFSISHCGDFAAAIIGKKHAGIDVELITEKVDRLKNKFLNPSELELLQNFQYVHPVQLLTLFWSCKEAIFKWYGKGKVDFRKNMLIKQLFINDETGNICAQFVKESTTELHLEFIFLNDLSVVWVLK
jgi:phosphopantetheinyl transferase